MSPEENQVVEVGIVVRSLGMGLLYGLREAGWSTASVGHAIIPSETLNLN
jgi:hypothetical protein